MFWRKLPKTAPTKIFILITSKIAFFLGHFGIASLKAWQNCHLLLFPDQHFPLRWVSFLCNSVCLIFRHTPFLTNSLFVQETVQNVWGILRTHWAHSPVLPQHTNSSWGYGFSHIFTSLDCTLNAHGRKCKKKEIPNLPVAKLQGWQMSNPKCWSIWCSAWSLHLHRLGASGEFAFMWKAGEKTSSLCGYGTKPEYVHPGSSKS